MESNTSPHTPAHVPYPSLECLLSISLRVPSWAGDACRVLPLCRACWHMPVIGTQRVTDFPPAWGKVRVCLQALVTPEVVCAEREYVRYRIERKIPQLPRSQQLCPAAEGFCSGLWVRGWVHGLGEEPGKGTWHDASVAGAVADPSAENCLAGSRGGGQRNLGRAQRAGAPWACQAGNPAGHPGSAQCSPGLGRERSRDRRRGPGSGLCPGAAAGGSCLRGPAPPALRGHRLEPVAQRGRSEPGPAGAARSERPGLWGRAGLPGDGGPGGGGVGVLRGWGDLDVEVPLERVGSRRPWRGGERRGRAPISTADSSGRGRRSRPRGPAPQPDPDPGPAFRHRPRCSSPLPQPDPGPAAHPRFCP